MTDREDSPGVGSGGVAPGRLSLDRGGASGFLGSGEDTLSARIAGVWPVGRPEGRGQAQRAPSRMGASRGERSFPRNRDAPIEKLLQAKNYLPEYYL